MAFSEESSPSAHTAAVQTLLREEQLYPGKISGVLDQETIHAIRRFQIVHSLRVNGKLDEPTLAAMHLPLPVPSALMETDRQFLHQLPPQRPPEPVAAPEAERNLEQPIPSPTPVAQAKPERRPPEAEPKIKEPVRTGQPERSKRAGVRETRITRARRERNQNRRKHREL